MSREKILSDAQLMKILEKKCKGTVTELTKIAYKLMKENTKSDLYGKDHLIKPTKKKTYKNTGAFLSAISMEKTLNTGESFFNRVYIDEDVLYNNRYNKGGKQGERYLGAYTDCHKRFVGDELIQEMWLEDGTSSGLLPRNGAGMMEHTISDIEEFIDGTDIEFDIHKELGDVIIEKFK